MMYKLFTWYPWGHPEKLLVTSQKLGSFLSLTEFIIGKTLTGGDVFEYFDNIINLKFSLSYLAYTLGPDKK